MYQEKKTFGERAEEFIKEFWKVIKPFVVFACVIFALAYESIDNR